MTFRMKVESKWPNDYAPELDLKDMKHCVVKMNHQRNQLHNGIVARKQENCVQFRGEDSYLSPAHSWWNLIILQESNSRDNFVVSTQNDGNCEANPSGSRKNGVMKLAIDIVPFESFTNQIMGRYGTEGCACDGRR
ncbi:hypothetical protein Ancab_004447 [Ancistrocladus abbreviatus]